MKERATGGWLDGNELWYAVGMAQKLRFVEALVDAVKHLAIAGRHQHGRWGLAIEICKDFIGNSLVAFGPPRVTRMDGCQIADRIGAWQFLKRTQCRPAILGGQEYGKCAIAKDHIAKCRTDFRHGQHNAIKTGAAGHCSGRHAMIA